jgi:dephospho-CoA kinase
MLNIGITGGIGSGKSTVARVFETLGIPVYNADDAAKRLMQEDPELKKQIIILFGEKAYEQGKLNRSWISAQVFGDPEKVKALNAIVHPATIRDAHEWMSAQQTPYTLKEAALIFESGSEKSLDYVIGVDAPQELRIQRVMERDNITRDAILQRMNNQMDEAEKIQRCDFIIYNDGNQLVIPQVIRLHQQLVELSKSKSANG